MRGRDSMIRLVAVPSGMPRTTGLLVGMAVSGLVLGAGLISLPCLFHLTTGLDCPFCGGSRMIGALLRGDVLAALDLNAFALLVLPPVILLALLGSAYQELGRTTRAWPSGALGHGLGYGILTMAFVWGVVRNLPFEPFTVLRA